MNYAFLFISMLALAASFFFWKWWRLKHAWEKIELFLPASSINGGGTASYYFKNFQTGTEELSPHLRQMFNLPKSVNTLSVLLSLLTEYSAGLITGAIANLDNTSAPSTTFRVQTNAPRLSERRFFDITARNIFTRKGNHKGVALWFHDVTKKTVRMKRLKLENTRLKEDYKHISNLLNAVPFPLWFRDENLHIRFCNLSYSMLVDGGNDHGQAGPSAMELTKHAKIMAKQAQQSRDTQSEQEHIIVRGQRRLYDISEIPIQETRHVAGYAYDITEKEELQDDLERHLAAQACLLESSASAMALFGFDTRLKFYNNAYVKLWGLDETWLAGQPTYGEILEALREKRKLPEQANFPAFKKQHLLLFTDLIEPHNEFFYLPDGTALRVIAIPHALGGLLFAYEDMTDKLAMERSYNTLIAVQRATLDNLHEGVAVFGQNGRLKLSNPMYARLWGLESKMLESEPHISHILEHTKHLYRYGINWQAFKEQIITQATQRQPIHERFERTDGKLLEWIGVPLPDGAILMTYLDVTDSTVVERSLRERNEALLAADRLKTEFLANVSYELRSPLTTIIGFAEILRTYFKGHLEEKEQGYLQAIYHSSQHLMALINDILDLASIEAGYMKLNLSRFNVSKMLNAIAPLIRQRIKESQLMFRIRCNQETGEMIGDELRIKQVIFKLISNAIKFSKPNSTIILGADARPNNEIAIWVEDRGTGISEEERQKVFDKFYKSPGARTNDSGTGLGLAVVKHFVQLHGGRIELESEVDIGTKFTCYFQRKTIQPAEEEKGIEAETMLANKP